MRPANKAETEKHGNASSTASLGTASQFLDTLGELRGKGLP